MRSTNSGSCFQSRCELEALPRGEAHVHAVRQWAQRRPASRPEALGVERGIDLVRAAGAADREEAPVVVPAAEGARAMAGGERGRLVEEEELGELPGLQERRPVPATKA